MVRITVTNYAKRPIDASNIYINCIGDVLEGRVLKSGWQDVVEIRCITTKVRGKEYSSILIEPSDLLHRRAVGLLKD